MTDQFIMFMIPVHKALQKVDGKVAIISQLESIADRGYRVLTLTTLHSADRGDVFVLVGEYEGFDDAAEPGRIEPESPMGPLSSEPGPAMRPPKSKVVEMSLAPEPEPTPEPKSEPEEGTGRVYPTDEDISG